MPIELILFVLLFATAVVIARLKNLFAAAMLTGIFSLVSAGLFTLMDAVDVAFTEAAVGAGISTILMLGTLSMTTRDEDQQPFRWLPLLIVLVTGAVLITGDQIKTAGAILPLTQASVRDRSLGTRHRAALGLSEETDALVIVVSEETAQISLAVEGRLERDVDSDRLREVVVGNVPQHDPMLAPAQG